MKTACGRLHFGDLVQVSHLGTVTTACLSCGRVLDAHEVTAYRRIRLQVKTMIAEAHEFLVGYLKKRAPG